MNIICFRKQKHANAFIFNIKNATVFLISTINLKVNYFNQYFLDFCKTKKEEHSFKLLLQTFVWHLYLFSWMQFKEPQITNVKLT